MIQNYLCLSGMTELLHHNGTQAKDLQVLIRTVAKTFVDNLKKKKERKTEREVMQSQNGTNMIRSLNLGLYGFCLGFKYFN